MAKASALPGTVKKGLASGSTDLPLTEPEAVGISSERLTRIRMAMQRYVDEKLVPGVVSLVARHGKVAFLDANGFRDVETAAPMKTDTIFRIASMTKPITSVALMMLFEEGHFLLSDPVSKWILEFADPKVALRVPLEEIRNESYNLGGTPIKLVPANRPIRNS